MAGPSGNQHPVTTLLQRTGLTPLGLLLVAGAYALPLVVAPYYLTELSLFVVYALAALGLMVLTGFCGLVSFGHAAFLGVGAYTHVVLLRAGVPFELALPLAGLASGLLGALLGRAASATHGIFLAIATLAFAVVVESVLGAWVSVTGGYGGLAVPPMALFGYELRDSWQHYLLVLTLLLFFVWGVNNLNRGATGRAMIAVRDSEISAGSLGFHVKRTRIVAFFISSLITGVAGGLLAHLLRYLSPESFGIGESIQLLLMVIVGGLGTISGALLGAALVSFLPELVDLVRPLLPAQFANSAGVEQMVFGLILGLVILFEPGGIHGRWQKWRQRARQTPGAAKALFVKQRRYLKTERYR